MKRICNILLCFTSLFCLVGCEKDDVFDIVSESYIDADVYIEDNHLVVSIFEYYSSVNDVKCTLEISTDRSMSAPYAVSFSDGIASWGPLSAWTTYYYRIKMENSYDNYPNDTWLLIMDSNGDIDTNTLCQKY